MLGAGDRLAAGNLPALARQVAERRGGSAVHRHRRVVPRFVAAAGGRPAAAFVAVGMLARVPARPGHVDAAAESEGIVDDDDLLVVAGAARMGAVELEVDLLARRPAQQAQHGGAAAEQVDRAQVPFEDVDLQARPVLGQPVEELAELDRGAVVGIGVEADAGVEVPADQQDLRLGAEHRLARVAEVIGRVDDDGGAVRPFDAPAVAARVKHSDQAPQQEWRQSNAASAKGFRRRNGRCPER